METTKDKKFFVKRKVCKFCTEGTEMDYKNVELLSHFVNERKKIAPRRSSGLCAYHQRKLAAVIKRARVMAFIPFTVLH